MFGYEYICIIVALLSEEKQVYILLKYHFSSSFECIIFFIKVSCLQNKKYLLIAFWAFNEKSYMYAFASDDENEFS